MVPGAVAQVNNQYLLNIIPILSGAKNLNRSTVETLHFVQGDTVVKLFNKERRA